MSRYGDYGGGGRGEPERWDPERFNRERGGRQVVERDRFEERERFAPLPPRPTRERAFDDFDYPPPRGGRGERFEERDRFFAEERYGPPARRAPKQERYYEEEEIGSFETSPDREDRRINIQIDRRVAPPRPGIIRRQSSLDTFDRKPLPRFPREPEVIQMKGPRSRRVSPPRYERDFEDIRVAEPDYYGDEEFRGFKEREVFIDRRRRGGFPEFEERDEVKEEVKEEVIEYKEEAPFPRRGKTKMPARLVNKRAIIELGYPFEEEGELVIILKALGKEQIDEVISVSKEMNRGANRTTYMIEAPPPPPEEIIERREIIIPAPPSEVPRSVREWDVMSGAIGSEHGGGHSEHGAKSSHGGGHSEHGAKSSHGGGRSTHLEVKSSHHSSRSRSHGGHSKHGSRSHKSRHSTKGGYSESESESSSSTEIEIEKKSTRSKSRHRSKSISGAKVEEVEQSNAMHTGPLALVIPHKKEERSERDIKAEIRELEAEKRRLKKEREHEHRRSSKYEEREEGEIIIERRGGKEREVKVEKDRRASDSKMMKAMLATLT